MSASDASLLNFWSLAYVVGAWAVVIGVVLEGAEIYIRRSHERRRKRFIGPIQPPLAVIEHPNWAHNVGDIGFLILVLALILEQVSHQNMESIAAREQKRLTAELTSTTKTAGDAIKAAGFANERAALVESNNWILKKQIEDAQPEKQPISSMDAVLTLQIILPRGQGRREFLPIDTRKPNRVAGGLRCDTTGGQSFNFVSDIITEQQLDPLTDGYRNWTVSFHAPFPNLIGEFKDETVGAINLITNVDASLVFNAPESAVSNAILKSGTLVVRANTTTRSFTIQQQPLEPSLRFSVSNSLLVPLPK